MKYFLAASAFYLAGHIFYAAYTKDITTFYFFGGFAVGLGIVSLHLKKEKI